MKKKVTTMIVALMISLILSVSVNAEEPKEDVSVKVVSAQEGMMCAFITNNTEDTIDELDVQFLYKDAEGKTIDMDEDGHDKVLPGTTVVSRIEMVDNAVEVETKVDIDKDCYPDYENHAENVEISTNEGNDCIILEITNNADVDIEEIEYITVFYKGEDVVYVDYPEDVYDVTAGDTITEKIEPYDVFYGDPVIEYDKYEVYLNQAHTFGSY